MAELARNEGFRVLEDFVCQAIRAPGVPEASPKRQGANAGVQVTAEVLVSGEASKGCDGQRLPETTSCSSLAAAVYGVLRKLVPHPRAEITYSELVTQLGSLPPPNEGLQARDPRLDAALGELVRLCRRSNLPAISALVVREAERTPGGGYYAIAHPDEAKDADEALIAWGREIERVRAARYPEHLIAAEARSPSA